ncbi:hypothetical protein AGLY_000080 [Aphis glycines]|uniref:Uncharacterized protein n=1 Tax=Aphis glycines TaxID=307491 RepID=A0A6G0U7F5_APHGL|nr:hypothetical protein AGLY_000080 [Aphis glycines]
MISSSQEIHNFINSETYCSEVRAEFSRIPGIKFGRVAKIILPEHVSTITWCISVYIVSKIMTTQVLWINLFSTFSTNLIYTFHIRTIGVLLMCIVCSWTPRHIQWYFVFPSVVSILTALMFQRGLIDIDGDVHLFLNLDCWPIIHRECHMVGAFQKFLSPIIRKKYCIKVKTIFLKKLLVELNNKISFTKIGTKCIFIRRYTPQHWPVISYVSIACHYNSLVLLEVIAPVEKYNLNPDLDTTNR